MSQQGVQITGMCNGTTSYTNKNNQENHQLLMVIPGSQGVLQISLPGKPAPEQYQIGKTITVNAIPNFFNGRLSGLSLG